ncbi:unannotated protein [freshwater metagenome]|uniref:Unannotated protein n=1 Tax=freshwater metagenome TaxID=449393 RepID=A0A6J7LQT5_9ZZZZ
MPGGAGGEPIAFEEHDVAPAEVAEVVGDGGADDAAADDDDACALRQVRGSRVGVHAAILACGGVVAGDE